MKERPILFSGEMVRAILESRKTQTRRIVKPKWIDVVKECIRVNGKWVYDTLEYDLGVISGRQKWKFKEHHSRKVIHDLQNFEPPRNNKELLGFWTRPSIFMPRWASRITLEIVDVRVERLTDISDSDCLAEGFTGHGEKGLIYHLEGRSTAPSPRAHMMNLWHFLNGPESWYSNPWVWVKQFKQVEK